MKSKSHFSPVRLKLERAAAASLVGLALFWVSYLMDWILFRIGTPGAQTLVNNFVIGAAGALVAYLWVRFDAERQARTREKMILLVELNHHIRNALVVLGQSAALENGPEKLKLIDDAVDRVDRVLTELVPTVGQAASPRLFLEQREPGKGPIPQKLN